MTTLEPTTATPSENNPSEAASDQQQHQQPQPPDDGANAGERPSTPPDSNLVGTTCMELALEGERLCKTGDFMNGIRFFEEAIKVGTNDDRTLSAIYSQLGNAYFYMEDYQKALEYHKLDVTLVHGINDEIAEAKACGNLGNTFKMLGKFDEAAVYCRRYLEISKKLNDFVGEGRALYNLGNVYHTQGKRIIGSSEQEPGELSIDIKSILQRAIEYYEMNLHVVTKLNDYASMGRAYGNLGNTHYLLGNFELAVEAHRKRLELAKQTNDRSAERRAHLNLGNANVFLGNFQEAAENYSATLNLAQELQDKYTEAHSCYSLANTYTFLRDYKSAIKYHLKYIEMIKEFKDKLGEGRACWSLVNIYQMVNDPESALTFAKRHHDIADQLGDKAGLASAKLNIDELEEIIAQKQAANAACSGGGGSSGQLHELPDGMIISNKKLHSTEGKHIYRLTPDKRQEQEQRRFKKQLNSNLASDIDGLAAKRKSRGGVVRSSSSERLFDMIAHFQSGRIDDQRCEFLDQPTLNTTAKSRLPDNNNKENLARSSNASSHHHYHHHHHQHESSNGASAGRGSAPSTTARGSQPSIANPMSAVSAAASAIKATYRKASLVAYPTTAAPSIQSQRRPTVSAEHREQLFKLIADAQGQRMDEQRASLPALTLANGVLKNPTNAGLLSRGHTIDQPSGPNSSTAINQQRRQVHVDTMPETIIEAHHHHRNSHSHRHPHPQREKSNSIAPTSPLFEPTEEALKTATGGTSTTATSAKPKLQKLSRHFQTLDAGVQVQDDQFLDSLMKYQSTRFNDQRSEFPSKSNQDAKLADWKQSSDGKESAASKNQPDNFFNLIVKFQADRYDDQRSSPPAANKNV